MPLADWAKRHRVIGPSPISKTIKCFINISLPFSTQATIRFARMDNERPIAGGNVADVVVRVDDTVRKPQTAATPAVGTLLGALEDASIGGVPRFLGLDDKNRQILSFVDGTTAFPTNIWTDDATQTSAARLLRRIHDATVPLVGTDHVWAYAYPDATQHQVIGHSDFAPYNMTFGSDGSVIGVFDFDLAGPAPRIRDLAYLAWWLVPLGQPDTATQTDLATQSQRLKQLCATYGAPADNAFLDMIDHVLDHMSDPVITRSMVGDAAAQALIDGGHLDHWARERAHFVQIRPQIAANLGL